MRTMKADPVKYSGILAEPYPSWTALTAPSEAEQQAIIKERMDALMVHYGLDPTKATPDTPNFWTTWMNLAWLLARDHVPGFQGAPREPGRPSVRKGDDVTLWLHLELRRRRDGMSTAAAIRDVVASGGVRGSEAALLGRHKRSKKSLEPLGELIGRLEAKVGREAVIAAIEAGLSGT